MLDYFVGRLLPPRNDSLVTILYNKSAERAKALLNAVKHKIKEDWKNKSFFYLRLARLSWIIGSSTVYIRFILLSQIATHYNGFTGTAFRSLPFTSALPKSAELRKCLRTLRFSSGTNPNKKR